MARRRGPGLTLRKWLHLAGSRKVRKRVASDPDLEIYEAILTAVRRRTRIDWNEAVGMLHMVYAWMPTMLRYIGARTPQKRVDLIANLAKAKSGAALTGAELTDVASFANGSIVGASKLLHVICPAAYPIWDSRVADAFLWKGVSQVTFSQVDRYVEYRDTLCMWAKDAKVIRACSVLRGLNPMHSAATDIRLMELVLFRSRK